MTDKEEVPVPKRTETQYETLFDATIDLLIKRVKDGTATASDLAVVRDFLKQAGIRAVVSEKILTLSRALPKFDEAQDAKQA